jgi:pimeloyl-ACP methyl ester carboxylesterase
MIRSRLVFSLIFILIAFAGVSLWRSMMREAATEADYPPEGQIVTVEGVRMHAVVRGKGRDLVLIHGASGSVRDFTFALMPALAARYRVIAIDRPGLGWSDWADGADSIHVQARLIRGAAAALGASHPIVLGHSYGGAVVLAWAVDAPETVAALVLVSAASHPWDGDLSLFYKATGHPVFGPVVSTVLSAWVPADVVTRSTESVFAPQVAPAGYSEHFAPMMSLRASVLRANALQRRVLKDELRAQAPLYGTLPMPIESVHGDADTIVGMTVHAIPLAAQNSNVHLTRLPGIGHMPHHIAQSEVIAAIDRAAARADLSTASDPMQ